MRLADFITSNLENILQEWQDYAQSLDSAAQMNAADIFTPIISAGTLLPMAEVAARRYQTEH